MRQGPHSLSFHLSESVDGRDKLGHDDASSQQRMMPVFTLS
jgi:hypothetical protein